jgi:hypothetical protein
MAAIQTSSGQTLVRCKVQPVPKLYVNSSLRFIPMNQRTHLEARLMWCEESIQRKLAMDLMQMLRSGILERLDNIVNSRNPAPIVVSFYTTNKTKDDVTFFPKFSKSPVLRHFFGNSR